jgi:hypothetical protein
MHSKFASTAAIAALGLLPILWMTSAGAITWFDGQEILVECPVWNWTPSPIPGVEYQLCFDDADHCVPAAIGDSVCIPALGVHDAWVSAIDNRSGEPIYYDGDTVSIVREISADFNRDGVVDDSDWSLFAAFFGVVIRGFGGANANPVDLDGDGIAGFTDAAAFTRALGKCVNARRTLYRPCE